MKKKVIELLMMLFLLSLFVGCVPVTDLENPFDRVSYDIESTGIYVYIDRDRGNVCYYNSNGLSCLPLID